MNPADRAWRPSSTLHRITTEEVAMQRWTLSGALVYWGMIGVLGGIWSLAAAVWLYQVYYGLEVAGLTHPVMWGVYIATFVFGIGVPRSGTLMSAILFLFRAHWRATIARLGETMTIAAIITA